MKPETSYTYRLCENIFIGNVDTLLNELTSILKLKSVSTLILDAENVQQCDMYGIQFFIQLHRKAKKFKKSLLLKKPRHSFTHALASGGILHLFPISDNYKDAQ